MIASKRAWLFLGLSVVVGGSAVLVGGGQPAEARFGGCKLDGVWVLRFGDELYYETFVTDALGYRGSFEVDPIIDGVSDFGSESPGPGSHGNIRRISRDTWEFESIAHGRTLTTATEPGSLTNIQVFRGVSQLVDCDTQAITLDLEIYLPDADADGDGFPDDGVEPIAVVEGLALSARRIVNL